MKRSLLLTLFLMTIGLSMYATGETYVDPVSGLTFKVIADFPLISDYQVEVIAGEEKYKGDIEIPSKVTIAGVDYLVTAIGEGAFKNCNELVSVVIPKGVTSIGTSAFYQCSINSIDLPEGVTEIKNGAFYGSDLSSITLPNTLLTIGEGAFRESGLLNLVIPNSVTSVGMSAFRESCIENVTLSSSMKKVDHYLFYNCRQLRTVIIPEGVESIGEKTFYFCTSLESITIPKSMKYIGDIYGTVPPSPFYECKKLEKVIIADLAAWCNIEFIYGSQPLYYAHHLYLGDQEITDLVIPEGVTSISSSAFLGGCNFSSLTIPETVKTIGAMAFEECSGLTSLTIPQSVETIENNAFKDCTGLTEIKSFGGVTELRSTFSNCTGLTSVTIPKTIKIIDGAFGGCSNLKSISVPSSLNSVKEGSFDNTTLESITVYDNDEKNYDSRDNCNAIIKSETNDMVIVCKNTVIPEGVEILSASFPQKTTSIIFPKSLKKINTSFNDASSYLRNVESKWDDSSDLSNLEFSNINRVFGNKSYSDIYKKGKLIVPVGCIELYKQTEPWNNFVNIYEKGTEIIDELKVSLDNSTKISSMWLTEDGGSSGYEAIMFTTDIPQARSVMSQNGEKYQVAWNINLFSAFSDHKVTLNVTGASASDVNTQLAFSSEGDFETNSDGSILYLNEGGKRHEIAYIDYFTGDLELQKTEATMRLLNESQSSGTNGILSLPLCVRASYNGELVDVENGDFKVLLRRPIDAVGVDKVIDIAYSSKSKLDMIDLVAPNDWRGPESGAFIYDNDNNYYEYYNVKAIEITGASTGSDISKSILTNDWVGHNYDSYALISQYNDNYGIDNWINISYQPLQRTESENKLSYGSLSFSWPSRTMIGRVVCLLIPITITYEWGQINTTVKLTLNAVDSNIEYESISIGKNGKATYTGGKALDFSGYDDLKAYVATGYESNGTIWMTRVKQVPAHTPIFIKGEADQTYEVPVMDKCDAYFENMFKGSADEDQIISTTTEDGKYKNFYMSGGQFKPASTSQKISAGKAYLQVPASFKAAKAGADQTVKIADSGKSSYAPPVDVDLTDVEGLKAYAATGYDAATSTIWLTRIFKIQAGEGVLLKGEAGKTYTLPSAEVQAYYGNMFVGNNDAPITINEISDDGVWTNFYLASGSFKKVSGTREIGTNKSYLQLPTSLLVSSARGKKNAGIDEWLMDELETETMLLGGIGGEDDGTTRIDAIGNDNSQPGVYYNLQGQRVDNPKKGLYIKNGNKVVIRSTTK